MDCVFSRPLYTYLSTINLVYYYTKVLLLRNYFYHQKCYGKKSAKGTSELRSIRPNLILVLAPRCLYWGGVSGVDGGVGGIGVTYEKWTVYCKVLLKTEDGLLQTIEHELRSGGCKFVPLLATRCLYLVGIEVAYGVGVHLTKHQPDPQADDMSSWPAIVPLLTNRCLYWGGGVRGWQV